MPATLTIHAVDDPISKRLVSLARREKKSMNQVVKDILAGHFGLRSSGSTRPKNDIMRFCGVLTQADAKVLRKAQEPFSRVDPEEWK